MAARQQRAPPTIVARLGEDLNWWLDESLEATEVEVVPRAVLDPRQVAHLTQILDQYRPYGFRPEALTEAFAMYTLDAELDDQRVRLVASDENIYNTSEQLFALPCYEEEGSGPYYRLLEVLSRARVQLLNQTHHYAHECTVEEMCEEVNGLDSDRYFCDEAIHSFDEINEILEWKPAEWDEPES